MKAENDLVGFVNLTHPHDTLTRRLRQSFKAARHLGQPPEFGAPYVGLCMTCRYGINWALVRGHALAIKVHRKRLPIRATRPGL